MARLLIVEDEGILSLSAEMEMSRLGHIVVGIADTAEEALMLAERAKPDLVLIDIVLKGSMTGLELARSLGESATPFIFITAHTDPMTIEKIAGTRHSGVLGKPYEPHMLDEMIKDALAGKGPR